MDENLIGQRWGKFSDAAEAELPHYRALSGMAVLGFLLGLVSILSIVHVGLCFLGVLALICCVAALMKISKTPAEMSGRWLAVAGLVLAVFWTTAGSARELTQRYLLDTQSRQFGLQWFEYLKKGQFAAALELSNAAGGRSRLDDTLLDHYLSSQSDYELLRDFVSRPEVRALLTLKDRAQVRHYACISAGKDTATQVYAVTYDADGGSKTRKTFLVKMRLIRSDYPEQGVFGWHTAGTEAPWKPDGSSE